MNRSSVPAPVAPSPRRVRRWVWWAGGVGVGLLNGLLSAGATLLVPLLAYLVGLQRDRAHGTALPIILEASAVSLAVYLAEGQSPGLQALWVAAGGLTGGVLGARWTGRVSGFWLRTLFGLAMAVAAWRMVTA